jgi:hypothetical protein
MNDYELNLDAYLEPWEAEDVHPIIAKGNRPFPMPHRCLTVHLLGSYLRDGSRWNREAWP